MQKSILIAFDLDNVLNRFNAAYAPWHNDRYGTNVEYEMIHTHKMHLVYGCTEEENLIRVKEFWDSPQHIHLETMPGATETILYLQARYWLEIVTARPHYIEEQTNVWVARKFADAFRQTHFTNGFGNGAGTVARTKSQVCKEIGSLVLIDDDIGNAIEVARTGLPVLMPDRPWNQGYVPEGVTRVHSWTETIRNIEALAHA